MRYKNVLTWVSTKRPVYPPDWLISLLFPVVPFLRSTQSRGNLNQILFLRLLTGIELCGMMRKLPRYVLDFFHFMFLHLHIWFYVPSSPRFYFIFYFIVFCDDIICHDFYQSPSFLLLLSLVFEFSVSLFSSVVSGAISLYVECSQSSRENRSNEIRQRWRFKYEVTMQR